MKLSTRIWLTAFNRTIVELKFVHLGNLPICTISFNRTIVELKFQGNHDCLVVYPAFNRTIVELKYADKVGLTVGSLGF